MKHSFSCAIAICLLSGCSTMGGLNTPDPVFVGTKTDINLITLHEAEADTAVETSWTTIKWFYGLIDLPFSFVADTILLPYTLTQDDDSAQ